MRRSVTGCAMLVVTCAIRSPAQVQFSPPRVDAAPVESRQFSRSAPAAAPSAEPSAEAAPAAAAGDSRAGRQHRSHHGRDVANHCLGGANGFLLWGSYYPLVQTGAFVPAVGYYTPMYPQYGFVNGFAAPAAPAPARGGAAEMLPQPRVESKLEPPASNSTTKARSGRYMGHGDAHFAKQNYRSALDRYATAARIAPDLAEPFFRQGFSQVALGQHQRAAKAFRRGLAIRRNWAGSPFRLDRIYGDDQVAKTAHLENLASAIEANPFDAELLVVLAIELYFDGQHDRADVFFARAAQLGANEDRLLSDFLPGPGPAGARARPMREGQDNLGAAEVVF